MIIFKTVRWKNFLSTGNSFTEIDLSKHKTTLILGENGSGKSTILDVLTFGLFGKPYRNINKPQLVNSVNNKDCLVEIDFHIGNKKYRVRRGIKPSIFEIFCDDELINQDAKSKDYQDVLERLILKMTYKSFTQIVILGSSSFIPFMQLTAADRRSIIEDLLDIQIFTTMNTILKDRIQKLKETTSTTKLKIDNLKEKIEIQNSHVEELKRNNQEIIDTKNEEVSLVEAEIEDIEEKMGVLKYRLDSNDPQKKKDEEKTINSKLEKLNLLQVKIEANKRKIESERLFYHDNDSCPTCRQDISHDLKTLKSTTIEKRLTEIESGLKLLEKEKKELRVKQSDIKKALSEIASVEREMSEHFIYIFHHQETIKRLKKEIEKYENNKQQTKINVDESLHKELEVQTEEYKKLLTDKGYADVAAQLLKDGGIKTKIVSHYLPIINSVVNKYLTSMDFFVNFYMDEEFKEVIKSRHRDDFSYGNFSEGEKQKIDISLLLTWREISRMKSNSHTNLLILDETFDSSVDIKGVDSLLGILLQLSSGNNIFVISHKDQMNDKFKNIIKFEKKNNFSRITK